MVIPSDTPIVPYCHPIMSCFSTACFTSFPRSCTVIYVRFLVAAFVVNLAYNGCLIIVSIVLSSGNSSHLLAGVTLPPDRGNADLRSCFHHLLVWHTCCVQHCLSSGKVMASGQGRRIFVQDGCAILIFGIIRKMRKAQKTWFFWLELCFEVCGIHG